MAGVAPHDVVGVVTPEGVYLDPQRWNSLWSFVPALKRVRRLTAANGSDSLFGSNLSHDDPYLFSGKVQYFSWKLISAQSVTQPDFTLAVDELGNRATVKLPLKPGQPLNFNVGLPDEIFTQSELTKRGK